MIKVDIEINEGDEFTPYPILKRNANGTVVLFTKPNEGLRLDNGYVFYATAWKEEEFQPFVGEVTISQ